MKGLSFGQLSDDELSNFALYKQLVRPALGMLMLGQGKLSGLKVSVAVFFFCAARMSNRTFIGGSN